MNESKTAGIAVMATLTLMVGCLAVLNPSPFVVLCSLCCLGMTAWTAFSK